MVDADNRPLAVMPVEEVHNQNLRHRGFFLLLTDNSVVLGGLFLAEVMSDVIQVASFKSTGRRVFRMAPLHHHFELGGWTEVNVVIRFWIVAGVCVVAGLGLFYAEYLVS